MSNQFPKLSALLLLTFVVMPEVVQAKGRIIGGIITSEDQYPYMVSLMRNRHHICGGTLITYSWVLTASHCLFTADGTHIQTKELSVVAGMVRLQQISARAQRRNVKVYFTHDTYSGLTTTDIAVVQVTKPFTPSDSVYLISLPASRARKATMYQVLRELIGTPCDILGWGSTEPLEPGQESHIKIRDLSDNLRMGKINIIAPKKCQAMYTGVKIKPHHICAMAKGVDACRGDSGGPLVCNGTQYGVTSFGSGCAHKRPGVYVRTDFFTEWIDGIVYRTEPVSIYYNRKYSKVATSFSSRMIVPGFPNSAPNRNASPHLLSFLLCLMGSVLFIFY